MLQSMRGVTSMRGVRPVNGFENPHKYGVKGAARHI